LFAKANGGHPANAATTHPATFTGPGVVGAKSATTPPVAAHPAAPGQPGVHSPGQPGVHTPPAAGKAPVAANASQPKPPKAQKPPPAHKERPENES
jgi:hypothetical protein